MKIYNWSGNGFVDLEVADGLTDAEYLKSMEENGFDLWDEFISLSMTDLRIWRKNRTDQDTLFLLELSNVTGCEMVAAQSIAEMLEVVSVVKRYIGLADSSCREEDSRQAKRWV